MTEAPLSLREVGDVLRSADLLTEVRGTEDVAVSGVTQDSRDARPGDLFLAWRGTAVDAHDYVGAAVERGAVAAVVERPVEVDVPQVVVREGRRAAALAADAVMGSPSREMLTVGVTGTNGKTTTALLVRHLLTPDVPTAVVGTLGVVDEGGVRPGTEGLTTPGPVQVAVWLRELADGGCGAVVLEASSHALDQCRLDGVLFDVALFTNLTQDHLDYHANMAAYRGAKARLIELTRPDGTVVLNADEPAWRDLETGDRVIRTFSLGAAGDVRASDLELTPTVSTFTVTVEGVERVARTPLVGRYNVENAIAAVTVALVAGIPLDTLIDRLADAPPITGRLEAVQRQPFAVLIDFAHTPAALENALAALRPLTEGRLIVLFGAGGDRDRTKRRPMAEAVARVADVIVLTSDNPRTEDPERILDDLAEGLQGVQHLRIADRESAIRAALESARPGDTVVLAGKGHETYQVVGTEKRPFHEHRIAAGILAELGAR